MPDVTKVIFLDVDGVLVHSETIARGPATRAGYNSSFHHAATVDLDAARRVLRIVEETGAKIVVSSTWRTQHAEMGGLHRAFHEASGLSGRDVRDLFIGETPVIRQDRAAEVSAWLAANPVDRYVVIDDGYVEGHVMAEPLPNWSTGGLQDATAEAAIAILNAPMPYGLRATSVEAVGAGVELPAPPSMVGMRVVDWVDARRADVLARENENSLVTIGPRKPMGSFGFADEQAARDGIARMPPPAKQFRLFLESWGAWVYAWDPVHMAELLDTRRAVLEQARWPTEPSAFVLAVRGSPDRSNMVAPKTALYDLIADAYGDKLNPGRTDCAVASPDVLLTVYHRRTRMLDPSTVYFAEAGLRAARKLLRHAK